MHNVSGTVQEGGSLIYVTTKADCGTSTLASASVSIAGNATGYVESIVDGNMDCEVYNIVEE